MEAINQSPAAPGVQPSGSRDDSRARIVAAAVDLLTTHGRDAVTTRAVAAAAGVQAPAIYRRFGDKSGLLDAVAEHGFAAYLQAKEVRRPGPDAVEDLRAGWNQHVEFGLAHPAIYALMYGDPRPGAQSPAALAAYRVLQEHVRRVAVAGRLRVSEELAADLFHAAGCGTVLTLLATPPERRDLTLSETAREAAITAITFGSPAPESCGPRTAAIGLRAVLPEVTTLTEAERRLLQEWLDRLAAS